MMFYSISIQNIEIIKCVKFHTLGIGGTIVNVWLFPVNERDNFYYLSLRLEAILTKNHFKCIEIVKLRATFYDK